MSGAAPGLRALMSVLARGDAHERQAALSAATPEVLAALTEGLGIGADGRLRWPVDGLGGWWFERSAPAQLALEALRARGQLDSVESIDLSGQRLEALAPLSGLPTLRHLTLRGCRLPPLPQTLTGPALEGLDLGQTALTGLSALSSGFPTLRTLELAGCQRLRSLAPLSALTTLRWLDISRCPMLQDLSPLAGLTGLQVLRLKGALGLADWSPLRGLSGLLEGVELDAEGRLSRGGHPLEPIDQLIALHVDGPHRAAVRQIDVSGLAELRSLDVIEGLDALESLDAGDCPSLGPVEALVCARSLGSLELAGSQNVSVKPGQAALSSPEGTLAYRKMLARALRKRADRAPREDRWLALAEALGLFKRATRAAEAHRDLKEKVRLIKRLLKARDLDDVEQGCALLIALDEPAVARELGRGVRLDDHGTLRLEPAALKRVHLRQAASRAPVALAILRATGALEGRTRLVVHEGQGLRALAPLDGLMELASLTVNRCWGTDALPDLGALPGLRALRWSNASGLVDLSALASRPELTELHIDGCYRLADIAPLAGLRALERLRLAAGGELRDLRPIAHLRGLRSLELSLGGERLDLSSLQSLRGLERLQLNVPGYPRRLFEGRAEIEAALKAPRRSAP